MFRYGDNREVSVDPKVETYLVPGGSFTRVFSQCVADDRPPYESARSFTNELHLMFNHTVNTPRLYPLFPFDGVCVVVRRGMGGVIGMRFVYKPRTKKNES